MPSSAPATLDFAIQQAENFARRGDWRRAFESYRAILQDAVRVRDDVLPTLRAGHLVVADRFADLAIPLGYASAARELLSVMASLSAAAGNWYGRDYAAIKRVLLEIGSGALQRADSVLRSMVSTLGDIEGIEFTDAGMMGWEARRSWDNTDEADRAVLFSQLYLAMGSVLAALGSYGEALQALRRGLTFTGPNAPDLARRAAPVLRAAIAAALLEWGDLDEARREVEPLRAQISEFAEPTQYVRLHEIEAKLHLLRGQFDLAQTLLLRIVRLCQDRGFSLAECRARLNLAQVLIFLNKTGESRRHLAAAQSLARRCGDDAIEKRTAALFAAARARLASLAEGVSIAQSVAQMWLGGAPDAPANGNTSPQHVDLPQSANYLAFFEDRLLGAHWELGRGNLPGARVLLSDMRRIFGRGDSRLIAVRMEAFEALLLYYEGRYDAASAAIGKLLPQYEQLGLKPELWQLQRVLLWCMARSRVPQADQDALALISQSLLDEITATLPPEDQAIYNLNKWTADEEYLAAEINKLMAEKKRTETSPPPLRLYRRLQVARRLHALSLRIDRFKDEAAVRTQSEPAGRGSLRRFLAEQLSLGADSAMLRFLVLPDRVLIIQRSRFRLRFGVSPVTRLQLHGLVRAWHEWTSGVRAEGDFASEAAAAARQVADALQIAPALAGLSSRVTALRIVPDDSLHGFPFAAIQLNGHYLVERFALSIHASGRELRPATRKRTAKALFVGVSAGTDDLPALTMAGEELAAFSRWTAGAALTALSNETATRQAILAELPQCAFAHIACHGVFTPDRPEATGLVLVPRPAAREVLGIADIAPLDLSSLRHLTLSSCWSADNFILPGRWVVSLPQRFHLAGAEAVLACLWEVDQNFAVLFLDRYYSYLAELPPAEALARTQRDCLARRLPLAPNQAGEDAIDWAGYRIYGRAGRPLKKRS